MPDWIPQPATWLALLILVTSRTPVGREALAIVFAEGYHLEADTTAPRSSLDPTRRVVRVAVTDRSMVSQSASVVHEAEHLLYRRQRPDRVGFRSSRQDDRSEELLAWERSMLHLHAMTPNAQITAADYADDLALWERSAQAARAMVRVRLASHWYP